MKILIDIGHPAHVHYSRNAIEKWKEKGHQIIITARNKEVIKDLLKYYHLKFIDRGKGKDSRLGKLIYMLQADFKLLKISLRYRPDIFLSFSSPYAAQVAYILRKPHKAFNDTEHTDKMHSRFTYPFSSSIITPQSYQNDLGKKQIRFNNIDDGLYLHDNYFQPDISVKKDLGLKENEKYVILRFVSWKAHHDYGQKGIDLKTKTALVELLQTKFKVFISSEEELPNEFIKYKLSIPTQKIHHVLYFADLFIGESGTMASESAFLGTKAIYVNSLPLMCYLKIEQKAELLKHFSSSTGVIEYIEKLTEDHNVKQKSYSKALTMKKNFIDPTKFLVWFVANYPDSHLIMSNNPEYQMRFK